MLMYGNYDQEQPNYGQHINDFGFDLKQFGSQ